VARSKAAKQCKKYCSTPEAKAKYKLIHGNIVGVIGQAGIGKTTLTKTLVHKMLNEGLYEVDYIFYLKFRDIDYEKKTNLLEFLVNDSSINKTYKIDELDNILQELDNSEKVGIVLDGFDEAPIVASSKAFQKKCSICNNELAETFISNLLSGRILPRSKLLVTSRPRQLFELPKEYKPKFIVNILGLSSEGQEQICRDICNNEKDQIGKLVQYINKRPDLKQYCYVPINCIFVMFCIFSNFLTSDMINIDSITTILVATLGLFIENGHLCGEEFQIKNLCQLAFVGFTTNKLYFEKYDLKNANINEKNASTFLTSSLAKAIKLKLWEGIEKIRTYFSHLILHEFFVALHLLLFADDEQFETFLNQNVTTSKYEMVTKFMFGLCNSTTLQYLQGLIPSKFVNLSIIERKKQRLKSVVCKDCSTKRDELFDSWPISQPSLWVYELRDDQFTQQVSNLLGTHIKLDLHDCLSSDFPAFHYLLRARTKPLTIELIEFDVTDKDASNQFFSDFHVTLQNPKINVSLFILIIKCI